MNTRTLLLLLSFYVAPAAAFDECCLCDPFGTSPVDNARWDSTCWTHPEKSEKWIGLQYTCADASVDAFDYMSWDTQCTDIRNEYAQKCCTKASRFSFEEVEQPPPTRPPIALTQGIWPRCDICFNKQFPGKPFTITTVQYVDGNPTCSDLFYMGRYGHIEDSMCYPLSIYMQDPCGCNIPPYAGYVAPVSPVAVEPTTSPTSSPSRAPSSFIIPPRKERSDSGRDRSSLKLSTGRTRGVITTRNLEQEGVRGTEGEEHVIDIEQNTVLEPLEIVEIVQHQRAEAASEKTETSTPQQQHQQQQQQS